jgi:hypothetical protein
MPQLRPLDVRPARLRSRVFPFAPNSFSRTLEPSSPLLFEARSLRFSAVWKLIGALLRGASAPKWLSISIDRVRRKRQRLPSSLLIENVAHQSYGFVPASAATFPIKANDKASMWMAEAGEPIAMAAGSVLRAARISPRTAHPRDQMYDTPTAVNLDSACFVNHIEADGQTRPDVRLANACTILWWRVEDQGSWSY